MFTQNKASRAASTTGLQAHHHADGEDRPFLADTEKQQGVDNIQQDAALTVFPSRSITSSWWTWLHISLILIYTTAFSAATFKSFVRPQECSTTSRLWSTSSPAHQAVQHEARPVDGLAQGSIFAGYPSVESDAAWGKLLEGINLRVLPSEAESMDGFESLELRDGSGYLGVLAVYHELHCIKRLRKWIYKDYYYPNMTEEEYHERETHADHCLEFARQSAMCHGDTTMTGFKWLHDSAGRVVEPTTREGAVHQCVNWEKLSGWAQERRVNLFDPKLLVPEGAYES